MSANCSLVIWWGGRKTTFLELLFEPVFVFQTELLYYRTAKCLDQASRIVICFTNNLTDVMYEHDANMLIMMMHWVRWWMSSDIVHWTLGCANLSDCRWRWLRCWCWWWWLEVMVREGALSQVVARIIAAPANENDPALCNMLRFVLVGSSTFFCYRLVLIRRTLFYWHSSQQHSL